MCEDSLNGLDRLALLETRKHFEVGLGPRHDSGGPDSSAEVPFSIRDEGGEKRDILIIRHLKLPLLSPVVEHRSEDLLRLGQR